MIEENSKFILFFVCLLLSGFFSGSEVALISINLAKVRTLVERNLSGSHALEKLKKNSDHLLITILVGNNVVNIGAAALATSIAIEYYGDVGVGIATGVVTILLLIFGEIGPKTYAARKTEKVALLVSWPILYLSYFFYPLLRVYDGIKKIFSIKGDIVHPAITEEEIKQWIDVGEEAGTIEEEEHEMLYRVFRFTDTIAKEAMTSRADVVMIDEKSSLEESINIFNETGFSRLPVYHEQIDNIIGILNVKDVFAAIHKKLGHIRIRDLMYDPYFIPESKKVDDLLKELQIRKVHLSIVLDEYGTVVGIITVEDILEELVGEILDEFDVEEPEIQIIDEGVYLIDAGVWVDRINEDLNLSLPLDESYETIGGLLIDRLGHIPRRGELVEINDGHIRLMVMKMHGRRIVDVKLILSKTEDSDNN